MKTYKDEGIVFKQIELGEADRIVSILTKYHGRVDAVAKGVRKLTSRKSGSIDLGYHSKFAFARGKNLDIITETELNNSFSEFTTEMKLSFWLFFICEVIDNFIKDGEKQREVFDMTLSLFDILIKEENPTIIYSYVLKILQLSGFNPNLKTCLKCGNKLEGGNQNYLANRDLGFLCASDKFKSSKKVSDRIIKSLRYLLEQHLQKSVNIKMTKQLIKKVGEIVVRWTEIVLDKEMKSKKFILDR